MFPSQSCNKCISYEGKTLASVNIYIGKYSKFKSLNIWQLSILNNSHIAFENHVRLICWSPRLLKIEHELFMRTRNVQRVDL